MHPRLVLALLFGLMASVFGCDPPPQRPEQSQELKKQFWGGLDIFSCSLDLKSDQVLRWYLFHPDGWVSVTLGLKKGAKAADLWRWVIKEEWLQILDDHGKVIFQMRPIKLGANEISVDNGHGSTEVFEIQPFAKPSNEPAPNGNGKP